MADQGLDAEKLDVLRRWGSGLQADGREEVAAAGRAITLLIEEIERLHVLLWDKRLYPDLGLAPSVNADPGPATDDAGQSLFGVLRRRLRRPGHGEIPQANPASERDFHW